MAQTIVIGIEPTTAERVTWIGGELARRLGARAVLAHVDDEVSRLSSMRDRERARHRSTRRGHELLGRSRAALPPGVDVEQRVALGGVAPTLGDLAEEMGAALLVVGSRGRGAIASAVLGSVSQSLARAAPCPVTIIPPSPIGNPRPFDGTPGSPPTMVAGMDGSAPASTAVEFAGALADGLGHRLVRVQLRDGARSSADTLQAISATENARMIVIAAEQGNGGRGHHRRRSLATRLPRLARCPVTVVPIDANTTLEPGRWG